MRRWGTAPGSVIIHGFQCEFDCMARWGFRQEMSITLG
jgi:hypothetical protein